MGQGTVSTLPGNHGAIGGQLCTKFTMLRARDPCGSDSVFSLGTRPLKGSSAAASECPCGRRWRVARRCDVRANAGDRATRNSGPRGCDAFLGCKDENEALGNRRTQEFAAGTRHARELYQARAGPSAQNVENGFTGWNAGSQGHGRLHLRKAGLARPEQAATGSVSGAP